jgi:hypothetical protein
MQSAWDSPNPVDISGTLFADCAEYGILLNSGAGTTLIADNRFVDCGYSQAQNATLAIEPGRGQPPVVSGIVVRNNTILRHGRDGGMGISLTCRSGRKLKSVVISGNFIGADGAGAERNRRFGTPIGYSLATGADVDGVVISNNIYVRPHRAVENLLAKQGESGPMPAMSDNQAIGLDEAASSLVVSDGRSLLRLHNEGPVILQPSGTGEAITPRLNPDDYVQGQKLVLTNGSTSRKIYLPQSSETYECVEGRYLSPGVFVTLIRDRDKLCEVTFEDRRARHYAEVTDGTDIAADGFHDIYVSVQSERRFVSFSGIGHGARIRIIATNRNVTISNNEYIQLHSNADYEMVENEVKNFMRTRDGMLREI